MTKCNHYDKEYDKNSTLGWVEGWNVTTEELTCTVCGEVVAIRDKI